MRHLPLLVLVACAVAAADDGAHGHAAVHGGCLNAIGTCENGHAEVRLEGTTLRLWFVGGGNATTSAVRVPDAGITLSVADPAGGPPRTLVLAAKPLLLAEERVGDCSCFAGEAPWLAGLASLHATGTVTFHGAVAKLVVDWPQGYDPDDAPAGTKP